MHCLKNIDANPDGFDSRRVASSQDDVHPLLEPVVRKHLRRAWLQPVPGHTQAAFTAVQDMLEPGEEKHLVLDSGCGNGASTERLGRRFKGQLVIGIDRSRARLQRVGAAERPRRCGNLLWVRAELAGFWRLALAAGWRVQSHYLLYPNPWPKAAHLLRRWHAHPVFPSLLALGGDLTLRTNWDVYAREFSRAVDLAVGLAPPVRRLRVEQPLSPFERKYARSGHDLYEVTCHPGICGANVRDP